MPIIQLPLWQILDEKWQDIQWSLGQPVSHTIHATMGHSAVRIYVVSCIQSNQLTAWETTVFGDKFIPCELEAIGSSEVVKWELAFNTCTAGNLGHQRTPQSSRDIHFQSLQRLQTFMFLSVSSYKHIFFLSFSESLICSLFHRQLPDLFHHLRPAKAVMSLSPKFFWCF